MENNVKLYPSNPLGIIAIFVFFIEAITASSLHLLKGQPQLLELIVYFIIGFPTLIAAAFFITLVTKREALFAPGDFKDEDNFIRLLKRVNTLERDQKVNEITEDPPTNLEAVISLADDLIKNNETKNVIRIGRAYFKANDFTKAKFFFIYVKNKVPKSDKLYYKILSNLAYAEIGLQNYKKAEKHLRKAEDILGKNIEIWQLAAMAYTKHQMGNLEEFETYLDKCKAHPNFLEKKPALKILYNNLDVFA